MSEPLSDLIRKASETLDSTAHELGMCYSKIGMLSVTVRNDGEDVSAIYPKGYEKEVALMLYAAADLMVAQSNQVRH